MTTSAYTGATIIRAKHDNQYFCMHRLTAQDENLSFEARGMIAYLLSKPDGWEIQVDDLKQKCAKGRVYRILDELSDNGYLKKAEKYQNKEGKWCWNPYVLYERPQKKIIPISDNVDVDDPDKQKPEPEKPDTDLPDTEIRDTEKPDTENADTLDSTDQQSIDNDSKDIDILPDDKNPSAQSGNPSISSVPAFFEETLSALETLGLKKESTRRRLQSDFANYEPSEWKAAIEITRTSQMDRSKTIPDPYRYCIGVLENRKADRQKELDIQAKIKATVQRQLEQTEARNAEMDRKRDEAAASAIKLKKIFALIYGEDAEYRPLKLWREHEKEVDIYLATGKYKAAS